ncbi:MAG: DUF421 domain-containing protein [Bacteroidetes bacterium]|nr:DUF421 domain-containing protein [Bacteroidota bacterium]
MDFDALSIFIVIGKSIAVYVFIVLAIRLFGKKELAQLSVMDLVFILLISNSVQNAMVGADNSLIGGLAAATGLFLINYLFKWVLQSFPSVGHAIQGRAMMLIYRGNVLEENLNKSMLTNDELHAVVREHGVEKIEEVDLAVLEVDGSISVMSKEYAHRTIRKRKAHKAVTKSN